VYVRIHIYHIYFTDACSLTHSLLAKVIGPARPRTSPPPSLPPLLPPTPNRTSPKPPIYPQVSTIPPNAPFSLQPNDLAQTLPGLHNDPRSDPPVYVHMHIYRICFADACSPTHSPRAPAICFAGPPTLPPPRRLLRCPHASKYTFSRSSAYLEVSTISFQHVVQHPIAYNLMTLPRPRWTAYQPHGHSSLYVQPV